ncbi:MAG: hypothetical protein H6Q29_523 [Bacteroidetes bacterium]|nr:hypothetical protein [Bacteroidota bacterium]
MGLYPQPNKWQCGPFALKHALIMLGKFIDEKDVSRIAGTHWWAGTDEVKLARAARKYDCSMKMVRRTSALRAKRELLLALKRGYPCLLCVDGWSHWITIVGAERGKFIYIDSSTAPVVRVDEWRALKRRWVYREIDSDDPSETKTLYDLHPLVPRFRVRTQARFSLKRARFLRRPENRSFATYWDEYFNDLLSICTPRTPRSANVIPVGAFLRRHGAMISKQVAFWHGAVRKEQLNRVLRNFRFAADTYDLVIRADDEKRAIAALSSNLSLWAAGKYGVDAVYGEG